MSDARYIYGDDGSMTVHRLPLKLSESISDNDYLGCMLCIEPLLLHEPDYATRSRILQILVKERGMTYPHAIGWYQSAICRGVLQEAEGRVKHYRSILKKGPNWHKALTQLMK